MSNVKNISGNWTVEKLWRIFRSLQPVCIIIPAWNCVTWWPGTVWHDDDSRESGEPQQHFGGSHWVWEITWSCPGALAKSGSSHRWSLRSEKDGEDTIVCTLSWPYDFVKQCLHCSVKHKSSCLDEKYRFMRNLSEYQHSFLPQYVHASEQQFNVETIFILSGSCILKQAKG